MKSQLAIRPRFYLIVVNLSKKIECLVIVICDAITFIHIRLSSKNKNLNCTITPMYIRQVCVR
jgi:hypothetical protein